MGEHHRAFLMCDLITKRGGSGIDKTSRHVVNYSKRKIRFRTPITGQKYKERGTYHYEEIRL